MRILVIGGTNFVGRAFVELALERGHTISLFNRGKTNPDAFAHVEKLVGDRTSDLSALEGKTWDAVVDPSGYTPAVVRKSAELLAGKIGHYTFISSISVYGDFSQSMTEETVLGSMPEGASLDEVTMETYGPLKVLCEQAVEAALPGQVLTLRPGFIVGRYDPTDRFTYWMKRTAEGGRMAVPPLDSPMQIIDARDLAAFNLDLIERGTTGTFNVTGPQQPHTLGAVIEAAKQATGASPELVEIDADFVTNAGMSRGFPLWFPPVDEYYGVMRVNADRAVAAGLTFRSLQDTVDVTHQFHNERPSDYQFRAGPTAEDEAKILSAWDHRGN